MVGTTSPAVASIDRFFLGIACRNRLAESPGWLDGCKSRAAAIPVAPLRGQP